MTKYLLISLSTLVLFFNSASSFATCDFSLSKPFNVTVTAWGEDSGEPGMHDGSYVRQPSREYANKAAEESFATEQATCANICAVYEGTFTSDESEVRSTCRYERSYPKYWECRISTEVSCN